MDTFERFQLSSYRAMVGCSTQVILTLVLVLTAPFVNGAPKKAYVVIKATVVGQEKRQPTWICLTWNRRCTYIPADQPISAVYPARYRVAYIDFEKNRGSGEESLALHSARIKLEAGNIYFLGHLKLRKLPSEKYELNIDLGMDLLKSACEYAPEIFAQYPVANLKEGKKVACGDGPVI